MSNAKVISRCDCESFMNYYTTIESMENIGQPSVLNDLLQPSSLSLLTPWDQCRNQCIYGKSKECIKQLCPDQYNVFWGAYNNVLDKLLKSPINKFFVTLVNGYPGSGKSVILMELLIALSRTEKTIEQPKILITAGTDEEIDVLAMELHRIRQLKPGKYK